MSQIESANLSPIWKCESNNIKNRELKKSDTNGSVMLRANSASQKLFLGGIAVGIYV